MVIGHNGHVKHFEPCMVPAEIRLERICAGTMRNLPTPDSLTQNPKKYWPITLGPCLGGALGQFRRLLNVSM